MPQLTIGGKEVHDLPTEAVCSLGGKQGSVSDGKNTSYSTIFRGVFSLNHAREIVGAVNQLLVTNGKEAVTWFLYDHVHYTVL
jgi:hypothetical protein